MASLVLPRQSSSLPDLAAIRQRKGISLDEISDQTKISVRYLEAIERSEFGKLPGGIFNTSYIRQYARAIEYDEWDLLASYDAAVNPEPPAEESPNRAARQSALAGFVGRLFMPARRA